MVAIRLKTVLADQRTDPALLALDGIERVAGSIVGVEPGAGATIELRQRAARGRAPVAIGVLGQTADPAQLDLHRLGEIGRRRAAWTERRHHRTLLGGRPRSRGRALVGISGRP